MPRLAKAVVVAATLCSLLAGCRARPAGIVGNEASGQPGMPDVTPLQAEEALSDAMLVSAVALLLAFGADESTRSVSSDDGKLSLAWSDDADFMTGLGTYTMTMDHFSIPADDSFAAAYAGYVLSGTVEMASRDGVEQRMTFDLVATHDDPENHPVRVIDVEVSGAAGDDRTMPKGHIRINDREMDFSALAAAFELN